MSNQTKQRGSAWSIKLVFNLYKVLGYKFIYYLMYPVSFFYYLFASNVKESLKIYYKHLDVKFTNRIYYEHLRIFAICMVDRFIAKFDSKSYEFSYTGIKEQKEVLKDGAIILYSHFGGWAASSSVPIVSSKINIVMQEVMIAGIKDLEDDIKNKVNTNIIDLNSGTLSVSIEIANALMANEIVVMMADRAANEKGQIFTNFLGKEASFNKNPFQIAYKMNKPILVYFIVLDGIQSYKVEHIHIKMDKNLKEIDSIMKALNEYTLKYENIIRKYPNQWFNFYNFWEKK
jgi:predicted LPLAT superfamily acyltransferase